MQVKNVLKVLALGSVIGTGGLVIKNQQDEINDLRGNNGALQQRIDVNEQTFIAREDKQRKEFSLALESNINTIRKNLSGEIRTAKEAHNDLLGRVFALGKSSEDISKKLEGRIAKLETKPPVKTDEQKRLELVEKFLPSVVDITAISPRGTGFITGCVTDDRKGNLVILTCGHFIKREDEFLKTHFRIHLKNDYIFDIKGNKMPDGSIPWSSGDYRDFSIIRLTDEMQALLRKHNVRPIPIMAVDRKPVKGSSVIAFGREGKVLSGTLNHLNYYQWQGRWRTDIQTDMPIQRGDSGGPNLNLNGELVGITAWGPSPTVTVTGPKELATKLKIKVDAHTGINYFISNADLLRGLGSVGIPLTEKERNYLLSKDVLNDRPQLLAPPLTFGQGFNAPLLTYIGQLSELDGYAFRK